MLRLLLIYLFAILPISVAAQTIPGAVPSGVNTKVINTLNDVLRGCSPSRVPNSAIVGIRYDMGFDLCVELDPQYYLPTESYFRSAGRDGNLPDSQYPSTATGPYRTNYAGPSMHWCGPGAYLVNYSGENNIFICGELRPRQGTIAPEPPLQTLVADGPAPFVINQFTVVPFEHNGTRGELHACPEGYIVVGLHLDANVFLCGLIYPR